MNCFVIFRCGMTVDGERSQVYRLSKEFGEVRNINLPLLIKVVMYRYGVGGGATVVCPSLMLD